MDFEKIHPFWDIETVLQIMLEVNIVVLLFYYSLRSLINISPIEVKLYEL